MSNVGELLLPSTLLLSLSRTRYPPEPSFQRPRPFLLLRLGREAARLNRNVARLVTHGAARLAAVNCLTQAHNQLRTDSTHWRQRVVPCVKVMAVHDMQLGHCGKGRME